VPQLYRDSAAALAWMDKNGIEWEDKAAAEGKADG